MSDITSSPSPDLETLQTNVRKAVEHHGDSVKHSTHLKEAVMPLVHVYTFDLGYTSGQINKEIAALGVACTRNAVIGWWKRWYDDQGIVRPTSRLSPSARVNSPRKPRERSARAPKREKIALDTVTVVEVTGAPVRTLPADYVMRKLNLHVLTDSTCRYPVGDPCNHEENGFFFCGNSTDSSSPYCISHGKLAYKPASRSSNFRPLSLQDRTTSKSYELLTAF